MRTPLLSSLLCLAMALPGSVPAAGAVSRSANPLAQAGSGLDQARSLASKGRTTEAIALLDTIARRYRRNPSPALRGKALEALVLKSGILVGQDRIDECMVVTNAIAVRFGKDREPGIRAQVLERKAAVAELLCTRAGSLVEVESGTSTSRAYQGLMRHFGKTTDPAIAKWVATALIDRAFNLSGAGHGQAAIELCRLVTTRFGGMRSPEIHTLVNHALANQGGMLRDAGRLAEANAIYDRIFHRNQAAGRQEPDKPTIRALRFKGINLTDMGRTEEALLLFDKALARLQEQRDPVQEANLLVNKGYALGLLDRNEEAIAVYDDLLRWFEHSSDKDIQHSVAIALVNKGASLDAQLQGDEACLIFDKVIARFGEEPALSMQEQVAMAFLDKGITLAEMGRWEQAQAVFDAMTLRFGDSPEPEIRTLLFTASHQKGTALFHLERLEDAIAAAQSGLERFGGDGEPGARSACQNSLGYWRILQAKKIWAEWGRTPDVDQYLQWALAGLRQALQETRDDTDRSYLLGNLGYCLHLLGSTLEREAPLREAFQLGGETLFKGELEDAQISPCPLDEAFKTLVRRLWEEGHPPAEN